MLLKKNWGCGIVVFKMGFVHAKQVKVHISKAEKVCVTYPFLNKNGKWDTMFIEIDKKIFQELKERFEINDLKYKYI